MWNACRGQNRVSDALGLELQPVLSRWVLGIKPQPPKEQPYLLSYLSRPQVYFNTSLGMLPRVTLLYELA